jgi:CDP-glycerol glycerophosphotransferase
MRKIKRILSKIPLLKRFLVYIWWHLPIWTVSMLKPHYKKNAQYYTHYHNSPIKDKTILYASFHGKLAGDSQLALFRYLIDNPLYSDFTHVWAVKSAAGTPIEKYAGRSNVLTVRWGSDEFYEYLATARYITNNTTFPKIYAKREGQTYIQTWHGTPLKNMGKYYLIDDMKSVMGNSQRNIMLSDYFVNPSRFTAETMLDSYDLSDIYPGTVAEIGYPRVDTVLNSDRAAIRKILGVSKEQKMVLYVPTWRGAGNDAVNNTDKCREYLGQFSAGLSDEYKVIMKYHDFQMKFLTKEEKQLAAPSFLDTNELLCAADILITDYSSVFFDFLCTKRPILFFTYDLEEYTSSRGFTIDITQMPGPLCVDTNELVYAITHSDEVFRENEEKHRKFTEKFAYMDDGKACERLANLVFKGIETEGVYKIKSEKKSVLLYPGTMQLNGVTACAISLLNNMDFDKYNVYAFIDKTSNIHFYEKLDERVKFLYTVRPITFEGGGERGDYYDFALSNHPTGKNRVLDGNFFKREAKRLLGDAQFDIIVNFCGYTRYMNALLLELMSKERIIYLHSDMYSEYKSRFRSLRSTFVVYPKYDKLACVSDSSLRQNKKHLPLLGLELEEKMATIRNTINAKLIFDNVKNGASCLTEDGEYYHEVRDLPKSAKPGTKPEDVYVPLFKGGQGAKFVTIGRNSNEKNQAMLIRSFAKLLERYTDAKLYIVGDGPLSGEMEKLVKQLGAEDSIILTGLLKNPHYLLSLCDCFVLPSLYEGMPTVIIEAYILDKSVIASNIAGSRMLVNSYGGVLLEENDEGHLCDAMIDFVENGQGGNTFDYRRFNRHSMDSFEAAVSTQSHK